MIATDSLSWILSEPPVASWRNKIDSIGDRVAFVASGTFQRESTVPGFVHRFAHVIGTRHDHQWRDRRFGVGLEHLATVDEIAPLLFAEMGEFNIPQRETGELEPMELLIAGGPAGSMPQLAVLRSSGAGESISNVDEGRIVIAGAPRDWANERGLQGMASPAASVVDAAALAIALSDAFVHYVYRLEGYERLSDYAGLEGGIPEAGSMVKMPCVAFPLHVVVITSSAFMRFDVGAPSDDESAALAASLAARGMTVV